MSMDEKGTTTDPVLAVLEAAAGKPWCVNEGKVSAHPHAEDVQRIFVNGRHAASLPMDDESDLAHAAAITLAVNTFAQAREALRAARTVLERYCFSSDNEGESYNNDDVQDVCKVIDAALAAMDGKDE